MLPLLFVNKVQAVSRSIESLAVPISNIKTAESLTCRNNDLSAEKSYENGEREIKTLMSEKNKNELSNNAPSNKIGIEKEDAKYNSIGGNENEEEIIG